MKVLVAGATGALGRPLVRQLVERGHEVFGMTRSESRAELIRGLGATPVVADALDPVAVARAVGESEPEVIVHQATALSGSVDVRRFDRSLEHAVTEASWTTGIVLRYGGFYGPGTTLAPEGEHIELIRKRGFPIVGGGGGVWSFIHVEDAAEATVAAVEHGSAGIYNVVDDDPAPVSQWLPALADSVGAKAPRRVPRWLGRLLAGEAATIMMTDVRGASNEKAKRELGWRPGHPTWREGLA